MVGEFCGGNERVFVDVGSEEGGAWGGADVGRHLMRGERDLKLQRG